MEKYNAGLPFYLFKNKTTGFTWTKDANSKKYWGSDLTSSEGQEGVATVGSTLYIADNSSYYMGGRLYSATLDLSQYQNLGFSYNLTLTNDYCMANGIGSSVGINTSRSFTIQHDCGAKTKQGTKVVNIASYASGYVQVLGWARGYAASTMTFTISRVYLY